MGIAIRPSTQQTVDRIVGTAVVLGLSLVIARWFSISSFHSSSPRSNFPEDPPRKRENKNEHEEEESRRFMKWWWPLIALQRKWSGRRIVPKNSCNEGDSAVATGKSVISPTCCDDNGCRENEQLPPDIQQHNHRGTSDPSALQNNGLDEQDDEECEHYGSCQCGSIYFVLRGPKHLQAVECPGKIRYPHIPTTADRFRLVRGASDMRFYYNNTVPLGDLQEEVEEGAHSVVGSYTYGDGGSNSRKNANSRQNNQQQSCGAHAFCGNCGVHILRAPSQDSDVLEINANCLEDNHGPGQEPTYDGRVEQEENEMIRRPTTSTIAYNNFETVSENEPLSWEMNENFMSTARENNSEHAAFTTTTDFYQSFWESLEDDRRSNTHNLSNRSSINSNSNIPRKESISSTSYTHPESYAATNESDSAAPLFAAHSSVAESDDYSMGSSSITAASMPLGGGISSHNGHGAHSGHSSGIASTTGSVSGSVNGSIHGNGPFYNGSSAHVGSDRSVKTMPPRWMDETASVGSVNSQNMPFAMGERSLRGRYGAITGNSRSGRLLSGAHSVGGTGILGSSWSVSSLEPNDLDGDVGALGGSPMTVSPRMRDQMKKYMGRHMGREAKKET
mmetsp:Transcript_17029/g.34176  ORF Transcript_17029/g.34176 Transcript_17029/m.34176 type:complete len:618 (-) Transcript_17029:115-1968(-)